MSPPPAEQLATRILLGPALRAQPDRRLVRLVREGYEGAFEEIVRRYRRPLDRFAAAIVGSRSEDVTQDAFAKALLALRGSEAEIELRPWLYRIVRNTALNDLRDRPPVAAELSEELGERPSAAAEAERREEIAELLARLRALPEPQRAAIVMRELEGLSHEEIAAALGLSGGAARQAIYRARAALRDGLGVLVPLPLLRALFDHGAEAAGGGAVAASGAAAGGAGGAAGTLGGIGGGALKLGVATALIAGSVGAGVAIQHGHGGGTGPAAAEAAGRPRPAGAGPGGPGPPGRRANSTQAGGAVGEAGGASGSGSDKGGRAGRRQGGGNGSGGGQGSARGKGPGSGDGSSGPGPGASHAASPALPAGPPRGTGGRNSGGGDPEGDGGGTHSGGEGGDGHQSGGGRADSETSSGGHDGGGGASSGDHGGGGGSEDLAPSAESPDAGGEPSSAASEGSGGGESGQSGQSGGDSEIDP